MLNKDIREAAKEITVHKYNENGLVGYTWHYKGTDRKISGFANSLEEVLEVASRRLKTEDIVLRIK